MFGGIIDITGQLFWFDDHHVVVTIPNAALIDGVKIGDSIAINGVCLTVIEIIAGDVEGEIMLKFQVCDETKSKTTLVNTTTTKNLVNVELSLKFGQSLGGHLITGHVFTTGVIVEWSKSSTGYDIIVSPNNYWSDESICYKNSVAIDGVSLTIASVDQQRKYFSVSLLQYTVEHTAFQSIVELNNAHVNLEFVKPTMSISPIPAAETMQDRDMRHMETAFKLSELGKYTAPPNPWVGCVIVDDLTDQVIGKGFHLKPGCPHAEVNAFNDVCKDAHRNISDPVGMYTLFVTLEPCHHQGRTPPCDLEIIRHPGVKRVVIGLKDPDSRVSGKGIEMLRNHGLKVSVLEDDTAIENKIVQNMVEKMKYSLRAYIHSRKYERPYCVMKTATSIDGGTQDIFGNSQWITSSESRQDAHKLRAECQAIVIGSKTALLDKPRLNVRNVDGQFDGGVLRQPLRVVLDTYSRVPQSGPLFDQSVGGETLVFTTVKLDHQNTDHVKWIQVSPSTSGGVDLEEVMTYLYKKRGVIQCLIEGGSKVHMSFMTKNLLSELVIYESPKILGNGKLSWTDTLPGRPVHSKSFLSLQHIEHLIGSEDVKKIYTVKEMENTPSIFDNGVWSSVADAVSRFKNGGIVIVVDDESREDEGDLIVRADLMTLEQMNFILKHTTGIVCVAISKDRATELHLPPMVGQNQDNHSTAFTVSCDAVSAGTGVSASDRLKTVRAVSNGDFSSLRRPGHIFPLVAVNGGLSERRGHTEASMTLANACGARAAVLSELQDRETGEMLNRARSTEFAKSFKIPIVTIGQLEEYTRTTTTPQPPLEKCTIEPLSQCTLTLKTTGNWNFYCFPSGGDVPHKVLVKLSTVKHQENSSDDDIVVTVRIHSECFTGDVLGSMHCDCGDQLENALEHIHHSGTGGVVIIMSNHEGRGIGLTKKIAAYKWQHDHPHATTFDANIALGHEKDERDYDDAIAILNYFRITRVDLITQNPNKQKALEAGNIVVRKLLKCEVTPNHVNAKYLSDKKDYFNSVQSGGIIDEHVDVGFQKMILATSACDLSVVPEKHLKVAVFSTRWHRHLVSNIVSLTKQHLNDIGVVDIVETQVPGCWEIPWILAHEAKKPSFDADVIMCFGVLIEGDTAHFDHVSTCVNSQLMTSQIACGIPIINGILSCHTMEQAKTRTVGKMSAELAISYAITAVEMALHARNK